MAYAQLIDNVWTELETGVSVVSVSKNVQISYATLEMWDEATRNSFGLWTIDETVPEPAPGQRAVAGGVTDRNGFPARSFSFVDAPNTDPLRVIPREISRRQFFQLLAKRDIISRDEALQALTGVLPETLRELLDQIADPEAAFDVQMSLIGAATFERAHSDTALLAYLYGWDDTYLDNFWREAYQLP